MSTYDLLLISYEPDIIQPMVDIEKQKRGRRIAEAIEHSGKVQREIAELVGVTPQSITKWVKTGNIAMNNLKTLAKVTHVDVRYLLSGNEKNAIAESNLHYYTNNNELHELIDTLNRKQIKRLIPIVKTLLDAEDDLHVSIMLGNKEF